MVDRILVARAIVVNEEGKLLVLRRSPDDPDSPGRVDLPGGSIEARETYAAGIAREVSEETGLDVAAQDVTLAYTFTRYDERMKAVRIRLLYIAHVGDSQVRLSSEHDAYWWRTLDEAMLLFAEISWGEALRFVFEHNLA